MPAPELALRRLGFLVGEWRLAGTVTAGPAAGRITGTESFHWLVGGFFLAHRWESILDVGGSTVVDAGYEFFDYKPRTRTYRAHFFNAFGPYDEIRSKYEGHFEGRALVLTGPARVTRRPNADGTIACDTDLPGPGGGWTSWTSATLTPITPHGRE